MAVEAATPRLRKVALVARLSPLVIEPAHVLNAVGDQKESAQDVTLARRHLVVYIRMHNYIYIYTRRHIYI